MASMEVHLLVLIHGMWGQAKHLKTLDVIIRETVQNTTDTELEVLVAKTNQKNSTYDGIDWGGERVAAEVMAEVDRLSNEGKTVTKFSVAGYSLGGLLARYLIGILYQKGFFDRISPVNFNTFATPHIGTLTFPSAMSKALAYLAPRLLSRTGEQLYCEDKWSASGRPLLEVMADPECVFYQALALFPHARIYVNAVNDITVPYVTGAIETHDPFFEHYKNGIQIDRDEEYDPVIKSYRLPPSPPTPKPSFMSRWFKVSPSDRPVIPLTFELTFPFNIMLYLASPVIVPPLISVLLCRFFVEGRISRRRLKLLEDKSSGSGPRTLFHILRELEKESQSFVNDIVGSPDHPSSDSDSESETDDNPPKFTPKHKRRYSDYGPTKSVSAQEQHDLLTASQLKQIHQLNTLPNLRKQRVFIHPVANSHGVIICRDGLEMKGHEMGVKVIRHWAENFIL